MNLDDTCSSGGARTFRDSYLNPAAADPPVFAGTAGAYSQSEPANGERARIASLSAREREVVALITAGLTNKAIGRKLGISDNTVRHHLTSIFAKLETPDRVGLVVYAFRNGLADPIAD